MTTNDHQQALILKNLGITAADVASLGQEQREHLQQMGVRLTPAIIQQVDALRNHDEDPPPPIDETDG